MLPLREVATTRVLDASLLGGWGQRRRRDASVLAALALMAVLWMRSNGQAVGVVIGEAVVVLALLAAGALLCRFHRCVGQFRIGSASPEPPADVARVPATAMVRSVRGESVGRWVGATALPVPILSRVAIQAAGGTATAWEMVLLTTLGIAAIALVYCSAHPRHAALSVVCSGFLLLFTTAISDRVETLYLSILWVLICLWWMLANHWERLEVHLAQSVRRHRGVRFGMTALGLFVCGLAVLASWGRGPAARMLDGGVMPTSGGNRWADPSARSGVGDGDAVVAAKKHAVSFGAVESEMFLQSHQPSLYDLFDDVIGKPRPTVRSDKAVSLPLQTQISRQRKAVQSQQASAAFSIARESVQKRPQLAEKKTAALLLWVGPAGVRLAMQRYDHFDGIRWTEADPPGEALPTAVLGAVSSRLQREELGERIWYFRAAAKSTAGKNPLLGPSRAVAVKIINLRSARIPAPATTAAVHIADVGRDNFFDISPDGSFYMPGRLQVPALTVIRLVTHEVDADHLQMASLPRGAAMLPERMETSEGAEIAERLAREWTAGASTDWERAERIIQRLREDFVFDRLVETADTDLNEQQWLPIYRASESLSVQLRRMPRPLDMRTLAEIASYCELLETQAKLITVEPVTEDGFREQTDGRIEDEDTP